MISAVVRHVAAFGAGLRPGDPVDAVVPREPLDARGVDVVDRLRRFKLSGAAQACVAIGDLVLDVDQERELAAAQSSMAAMNVEVDVLMLRAIDALGPDGLVVLKGAAHAHLDHPQPVLREYGDLDLFVTPERWDEVMAWFVSDGFTAQFDAFAPRWARSFGKSVTVGDGRLQVDLHRNLSQGLALGVRPPDVLARVEIAEIAGLAVPVLDAPARLVHAAVHAIGGSRTPPVNGLCDIVRMTGDPARVDAATALARRWDVTQTLRDAILVADATLGGVPTRVAESVDGLRGSPNERRRRGLTDRHDVRFRHELMIGWLSLAPADRVDFARSILTSTVRRPPSGPAGRR